MRDMIGSTVLLFGVACSDGPLAPGAGNDPGTGTGTLVVEGAVRATARRINARLPTDFDTEFSVRATLDNQIVVGPVTVTSSTGKVALTRHLDGHWTGAAAAYDEVYQLDVASGADKAEGMRVDGPDVHVFLQPTPGATVDAMMPLAIRWDCADHAESATLHTDLLAAIAIPDSGSYSLAAGALRPDKSIARQHLLRLSRTNRVVPAGAAIGSTWTVTIENAVNVVTEAQPPL